MSNKWTDSLNESVWQRLANCTSIKKDIEPLTQARWNFIKNKEGYTKEDALIYVLELLDCNSIDVDMTKDEYNSILQSIF